MFHPEVAPFEELPAAGEDASHELLQWVSVLLGILATFVGVTFIGAMIWLAYVKLA
jgi:hypothetical protein